MDLCILNYPKLDSLLNPLVECLLFKLLPIIMGQNPFNNNMLSILSLPARFGGMAIINPVDWAQTQYLVSLCINDPLITAILHGSNDSISEVVESAYVVKSQLCQSKEKTLPQSISCYWSHPTLNYNVAWKPLGRKELPHG